MSIAGLWSVLTGLLLLWACSQSSAHNTRATHHTATGGYQGTTHPSPKTHRYAVSESLIYRTKNNKRRYSSHIEARVTYFLSSLESLHIRRSDLKSEGGIVCSNCIYFKWWHSNLIYLHHYVVKAFCLRVVCLPIHLSIQDPVSDCSIAS